MMMTTEKIFQLERDWLYNSSICYSQVFDIIIMGFTSLYNESLKRKTTGRTILQCISGIG